MRMWDEPTAVVEAYTEFLGVRDDEEDPRDDGGRLSGRRSPFARPCGPAASRPHCDPSSVTGIRRRAAGLESVASRIRDRLVASFAPKCTELGCSITHSPVCDVAV